MLFEEVLALLRSEQSSQQKMVSDVPCPIVFDICIINFRGFVWV